MADIAAADVTYTVEKQAGKKYLRANNREKVVLVKAVYGDAALTYPSGGVPLTTDAKKVGLRRSINRWELVDSDDARSFILKLDHENKKIRHYWPTGGAGAAPVADITNPASGTPTMSGADSTTITTHTHASPLPGQGKEFVAATTTVAAVTVFLKVYGW